MAKILFTARRVLQDEHRGTERETVYEEGKVYDLEQTSVDRWVARGAGTTDQTRIVEAERLQEEEEAEVKASARTRPTRQSVNQPSPDSSSGAEEAVKPEEKKEEETKAEATKAEGETNVMSDAATTEDAALVPGFLSGARRGR